MKNLKIPYVRPRSEGSDTSVQVLSMVDLIKELEPDNKKIIRNIRIVEINKNDANTEKIIIRIQPKFAVNFLPLRSFRIPANRKNIPNPKENGKVVNNALLSGLTKEATKIGKVVAINPDSAPSTVKE